MLTFKDIILYTRSMREPSLAHPGRHQVASIAQLDAASDSAMIDWATKEASVRPFRCAWRRVGEGRTLVAGPVGVDRLMVRWGIGRRKRLLCVEFVDD